MPSRHRSPTLRRLGKERQKARADAERQAIRERYEGYEPANVRTYGVSPSGFDYDAAIRAAAMSSVPPSGLPRNGDKIVGRG